MPVIYNKDIDDHTILAVWKIQESEEELLSGLQMKQHELDFLTTLSQGKRLLQWLSTRFLLRTMLNTSGYIDCRMDEHGKPYLVGSPYSISLSHSYDYAAVMIGRKKDVGVDIELIKPKIHRIQQKFLSPPELAQNNVKNHTEALYACWCVKEAVYKWYGKKGLEFRKHIHIQPFELKDNGSMTVIVSLPEGPQTLTVCYFNTIPGYMLGYVVA
ncbi:4'-phosphopantetheinyl transferase family protein [Pedobacter hartonius]|uniref:Phosphopantetheine--protein transferase domain-containing protein n=1 Tax=Pedobacter hartonius TaxID=425514 RepID=A0A1H3ZG01_9SPHI|nr:4'-phosphopantetheinyl transferase superfamily protein [Pedobacter hartonius]SEA22448.1 phosphopantetheine--protein transferase domain-containing protein [Pedobacter hartonius]